MNAIELLPRAVERNVAFVPGWAFYAGQADARTLRLSFVTASVQQINVGIAALAGAIRDMRADMPAPPAGTLAPREALPLD
jgi:2-aminoadipate transaminase